MDRVYQVLHVVLVAAYMAAPVITVVGVVVLNARDRRAGRPPEGRWVSLLLTGIAGTLLGGSLALIYARFIAGSFTSVSLWQILLAGFFGTSMLLLFKGFDLLVRMGIHAIRRRMGWTGRQSAAVGALGRVIMLVLVGLPFVMAGIMTYRPRVVPSATPFTELGLAYESVSFIAADDTELAGWWVPGAPGAPGVPDAPRAAPRDRVIVVHGLGGGKADVLTLVGPLREAEYDVLVFDLRAHGQSGGQLTSFGINETLDVEAAATWVRRTHGEQGRLLAVATSMGAAAVLAARDDTGASPFDAIAVMSTYDDLGRLADGVVARQFAWPLDLFARQIAVPAASLHAGRDLEAFRPADEIVQAWPVPMLVIHGQRDELIPIEAGQRLYEAAFEPRRRWWAQRLGHNDILGDEEVMQVILQFLADTRGMNGAAPV